MSLRTLALTLVLMLAAGLLTFQVFQRQLSGGLLALVFDPEIEAVLRQSMEDQRHLADLDPSREATYRDRYERTKLLLGRRTVLEHNRQAISSQFQRVLLAVMAAILLAMAGLHLWERQQRERRLGLIRDYLAELAAGETEIRIREKRNDTLGRIARMISETARVLLAQKQRLAGLENLSVWQEAARRHAHEIRTPLTAARMELAQVIDQAADGLPDRADELRRRQASINEELDRLGQFTRQFSSFAKLPVPRLEPVPLGTLLADYGRFFGEAWPNLELVVEAALPGPVAMIDREQIRQVLYNLCQNASQALAEREGRIVFSVSREPGRMVLAVTDNGPGIGEKVRKHLFKPYVTTRRIGEGMGLGLAISKKIMLDHGGDLVLGQTSPEGTELHLLFPEEAEP